MPETSDPEQPLAFLSPSGRIACIIDPAEAACAFVGDAPWEAGGDLPYWADGVSFEFEPAGCRSGVFSGFSITAAPADEWYDGPDSICAPAIEQGQAALPGWPQGSEVPTLPYGESVDRGPMTCTSDRTGVACVNQGGNGFVISMAEISMLFGGEERWRNPAVRAAAALDADGTVLKELEEERSYLFASTQATCFVQRALPAKFGISVECTSDAGTDAWTPDGASCEGADFNGFLLREAEGEDRFRGPTLGCTTDLGPLHDPNSDITQVIGAGEVLRLASPTNEFGIACGSSDGADLVCWNGDGNGFDLSTTEFSFFYGAEVDRTKSS